MRQRQYSHDVKPAVVLLIHRAATATRQIQPEHKVRGVLQPMSDFVAAEGRARTHTRIGKDRNNDELASFLGDGGDAVPCVDGVA